MSRDIGAWKLLKSLNLAERSNEGQYGSDSAVQEIQPPLHPPFELAFTLGHMMRTVLQSEYTITIKPMTVI